MRLNTSAAVGWAPIWLTAVLLVLRLTVAPDLPWIWVFCPMWAPTVLTIVAVVVVFGGLGIAARPVRAIVSWYARRKVSRVIRQFQRWDRAAAQQRAASKSAQAPQGRVWWR